MSAATVVDSSAEDDGISLEKELNNLLSSSSFSVSSYLNKALLSGIDVSSPSGEWKYPDELQQRMTELALQLQIQTQSCHEDIGRIGAELQAILPRCAADVGRVGVGLEGMRIDTQTLLQATSVTAGDGEEICSSLETLSTLHALQANISKTKGVLTAAATWDSTLGGIAPLLAEQNLMGAVDALAQLETGERALRGMPNRKDRQESIHKVRQQIQDLLQPQLKHALQNMHTRLAPLQQCVSLYSKLGKMDSLRNDYVKQRPVAVHKAWFSYALPKNVYNNNNNDGATANPAIGRNSTSDVRTMEQEGETTMFLSNQDEAAKQAGEAFSTWLPSWYETVLNLLSEERRQASTVFGSSEAPDILVKVLFEAFRPILPTFQSRLEIIFSSAVSGFTSGSFATICSIYESTLRFLSLTYDLIAGAFLDLVESGASKKGDTGLEIYQEMQSAFLQVGSPFALYAQRFDDLEAKNSSIEAGAVSNEIQKTVDVVSSSSTLKTLQDAVSRLKDLVSYIFPIVDGSLDRFELMNGGYRAKAAIRLVDKTLSNHLGGLVISVHSLSASVTADLNKFADDFDEEHVLCAMEVLKMVGKFCQDLRNFEGGTRNRMKALSERMADYLLREESLKSVATSMAVKGVLASTFSLPDSLPIVEIDSYLTKVFCGDEEIHVGASANSLMVLKQIGSPPEERSSSEFIYSDTRKTVYRLANSCHSFIFNVCSAVSTKHLNDLPQMAAWRKSDSTDNFDSYGTLPQQYITLVGEHMLSLVQAFEPFASDTVTLSIVNNAMTGVKDVALQPWTEFIHATGFHASASTISSLMNGNHISKLVLSNASLGEEDAALDEGATDEEIASAAFCNAWLDVIGLGVTGRLLEKIMRIPQLTSRGCEHLTADLNYLVNVFSALGVAGHPHPLLSHVATLGTLSDIDLEEQIKSRKSDSDIEKALKAIEARIAILRGISAR